MTRLARLLPFLVAAAWTIALLAQTAPTAVLQAPASVAFGQAIAVSGGQSAAASGRSIVSYAFRLDGGTPVQVSGPAHTFAVNPASPFAVGAHTVELVVMDDHGDVSPPDTAQVLVRDTVAPTAVIDMASVVPFGADVNASGARSSDVGGAITRYRWTLDGGVPVETSGPDVTIDVTPASPLALGRHDLQLVVIDDSGNESAPASDAFIVADTSAPTAVLQAPALVPAGQGFVVSGTQSFDIGGAIQSYVWTVGSRPPVVTSGPTFTVPADVPSPLGLGTHLVQLVVVDDSGNQSTPAVRSVRVVDAQAPTAIVTMPAAVPFGQSATASGAQSVDFDGAIVEFRWTLDGGPPVVTNSPTFVVTSDPASPLAIGRHTLQLVVVDDAGNQSAPAAANFLVVDATSPTAVITAAPVFPFGADITASGGQSFDVGGRVTRYTWTLDSLPPIVTTGPGVTFVAPAGSPFAPGPHVIALVVTDDSGNESSPTQAQVQVADGVAPTAVVTGASTLQVGQSITVSGAQSIDVGGAIVRYEWSLDSQPVVVTTSPDHTFVVDPASPLALGLHVVRLVVVDDSGNQSQPDVFQVRVIDSIAPTAVITAPPTVAFGAPLAVSGAQSTDVGGTVREYVWTLDGGIPFVSPDPAATFGTDPANPLALGRHVVTLTVTDDSGNQSQPAAVAVDVVPPPDRTPPVITLTTPPAGASYALHQVVVAVYACADADSAVATCAGPVASGAPIDTASVGVKTFTVTATDAAGNQAQVTHTYQVGYVFTGFFAPVDNLPVTNAGNAGRTYPIKWRLADGLGRPVTALTSFVSLRDSAIACDASPDDVLEDQLADTTASTLRYDAADDQFIYHWRTVKGVTGCRLLQLTLADGAKHYAKFKLR